MGNVCSPLFSCLPWESIISRCLDYTVRKTEYISHLQENLDALRTELQMLIEVRNDVKIRVIVAEQQQMRRMERVQGWLLRVQDVETQVTQLRYQGDLEVDKLCLGGFCSMDCKSSYKFGEKVFKALREVQSLRNEGDNFKDVAQSIPERPVDERPLPTSVVGLQSTFDRVWRYLMEEQMGIVGIYGMGGVGKTTLLTQINNKFLDTPNHFDFVIWVVVSKDLQLEKIQESIANKIGLFNESWKSKSLQEKAQEIFKILSNKKFVLLLDDIWELVDLSQVGLPVPSRTSASHKIVFTTREFEVCGQMEARRPIKVECLGHEDAWKLFEEKVGSETLDSHPDIPELAETVAKECGGLPLALITVGRAMAYKKKPRDWELAIEVLRSSASKFTGMENRVFSRLKVSYDFLPDNATRFCLLYCSLFPEDYRISIEDLIDCWICEKILDKYDGIRARNQGYSIIRTLIDACLLEEQEEGNCIKMHDVIRDMALWIATTIEKEEKFLVLAGVGLTEAPKVSLWKEVTRMSMMQNKITSLLESPASPHLQTLFLSSNDLNKFSSDFFQSMASLRVLRLSDSSPPQHLRISNLVSLQHLNLSKSEIRSLPIELMNLVNLKCLNLEHTFRLTRIPPQVISNLKMLRALRMYQCGCGQQEADSILYGGREALVEELLGLEHLNVLTITLNSVHALQILSSSPRLQSTSIPILYLSLRNSFNSEYYFPVSLAVFSLASLTHLQTLRLYSDNLEELMIDYTREVKIIREIRGFHCLQNVSISRSRLWHVTWLILAPNVKRLEIRNCWHMEEIISFRKWGEVPAEVMENQIPFARLEYLILEDLENLKSIHSSALPFPHLKEISVSGCAKLKKLPLDCNSGLGRNIIIKGEGHWWSELLWDDRATQRHFYPCFKFLY